MKIFVIMGKVCSGKDTLVRAIMNTLKLSKVNNFEFIVPYTTRKPRDEKEYNSGQYHFVTDEELNLLISSDRFIEVRGYEMQNEGLRRFATILPEMDKNKNYITIGTPEVAIALKRRNFDVCTIYLNVSAEVRLNRLIHRTSRTNKDYEEAMRRFLADEKDFSKIPKELKRKYAEIHSSEFMGQYNSVISYIASQIEDNVG